MNWSDQTVLITGGTGSLGKTLVQHLLPKNVKRLIVLSRDELKQHEMRQTWPDGTGDLVRYFIGDVRDSQRLHRAFEGVDIVIHAAALKQVPACEYNPFEAVSTNVMGAKNVIDAALDRGVKRVLMISTDKAVAPVNTYGKTKALAEGLFVQANAYAGAKGTKLAVARYGNVVGSRGSVVPLFRQQAAAGVPMTITDTRMTRFWLTLEGAVLLIERALRDMTGGEIFVPKIPSCYILGLADAIGPELGVRVTGIRPGEKLHESLISEDEARQTADWGDVYVVYPAHPWWKPPDVLPGDNRLPDGWSYRSDTNDLWLSVDELRRLLEMGVPVSAG